MRSKFALAFIILAFFCTSSISQTIEARDAFKTGHIFLEEGKHYSAIGQFKLVLQDTSYPLTDYAYFYIGEAYRKKGHFEYALQVYRILTKHFSDSILIPRGLLAIAICQAEIGNHAESAVTLRDLIARFPNDVNVPEARYRLGLCLEKNGEHIAAARVYQNLDLFHSKSEFADKALERLDRLAKESPLAGYEAPAATIYNLGMKHFNGSNHKKAEEYFTRLTKFYKKSSFYDESMIMLGRLKLRRGNLKSAANYFKKVINLDQDSKPEAMYYLARTHAYMGNTAAAIEGLKKIAERYPNHHIADQALYHMGRFSQQIGATAEAYSAYEKIVESYPNSSLFPQALWQVGSFHYKKGDFAAACGYFGRVFDLAPEKATDQLFFWTGKSADKMGDREKAETAYRTTIARFDHSYYAYRAREELKVAPGAIPEVIETVETINGDAPETAGHEAKYRELLALDLGDEAAEEAAYLEEKVPPAKKDKAEIAKYHAYVMKGKFGKSIHFAEKKIGEAALSGSLSDVDPRIWRFSYPRGFWSFVEKYSNANGLDPYLVYAVIREESRFNSRALSRASAHGLMQIIPSTGRKICSAIGLRYSRWGMYDPRVNIQMGTYFLAQLLKRFDGNAAYALAGYNSGPARVQRWLKSYSGSVDPDEFVEDIPLLETRNYVKKVLKSYFGYKRTYGG